MEQFTQLVLPGTSLRVILSSTWRSSTERCVIRTSVDLPTDSLTSAFIGVDTEGIMTLDEWESACYTLLAESIAEVRRLNEDDVVGSPNSVSDGIETT